MLGSAVQVWAAAFNLTGDGGMGKSADGDPPPGRTDGQARRAAQA